MSDLRFWLWLSNLRGLTPGAAGRCLRAIGSPRELFLAGEDRLRRLEGIRASEVKALCDKDISRAEAIEESCRQQGIRILCMRDAAYPERLRNISDPPLVIYVMGKLPPVDDRLCIGIVGTRKATDYGKETAARIAGELTAWDAITVTGLAEGIDSAAAQGALQAHGKVIAVLGTGVDRVYPAWNQKLQDAVAKDGALVSEYPPGTGATRYSFPQRNRIISGLSMGVVVVQAPQKSGALITASFAQEQGRDVFVVPGAVDDPGFQGSNSLIREGAQLVRGSADILEEYRFRCPDLLRSKPVRVVKNGEEATNSPIDKAKPVDYSSLTEQLENLTAAELKAVEALARGACYADELIRRCRIPAPDVMAALTMLQLKEYVREESGKYRLLVRYK